MAALSRRLPPRIGRYRILGRISSGGMGTVHLGVYLGDGGFARKVAIKFLHPHLATVGELVERFLDEAKLAARIVHPNVVATIDVVQDAETLCLVMDYVRGASLSALAAQDHAPVPSPIATRVAIDALHGLHAAHTATGDDGGPLAIVHRDVSPQNVLVGLDGVARIVDFGIAKAAGSIQTTGEGQLKGKLRYMAPEQILEQTATPRSDVYAAAVVLWELLAGRKLFEAANDGALLAKVLEGAVLPPSHFVSAVSPELEAVVLRALDRDPAKRPATAEEMALALEALSPTTAGEVALWVERLAGEAVREREASLATEIAAELRETTERTRTATGQSLFHVEHTAPLASDRHVAPAPASPSSAGGARRRTLVVGVALASLAALASLVLAGPRMLRHRESTTSATSEASEARALDLPSTSAVPIADPPLDSAAPVAPPSALPPAAPVHRAPLPTPRTTKPDCRMPYMVDPSGIRRVKRECL